MTKNILNPNSTAKKRLLAKNVVAQFLALAGRMGSGAIITIGIARFWGSEAYGQYASIIAFVMLFRFATDWGMSRLVVREIARDKSKVGQYVSTCLLLIFLMSGLTIFSTLSLSQIEALSEGNLTVIFLASLWLILGTVGLFFSGVFYAFERMELDTLTVMAEVISAGLLIVLVLPNRPQSTALLIGILVLSRIINVLASVIIYLLAIGRFERPLGINSSRAIVYATIPFGLNILFTSQASIHIVLLNSYHGDELTGLYRAAEILALLPSALATMLNNSLYPVMSRAYRLSSTQYFEMLYKALHYMLAISLPIAVVLFMLSERVISIVYGDAYQASSPYMRLLSLGIPLVFIGNTLAMGLTSADKQGHRAAIVAVGGLSNVAFGFLLIPTYGPIGASVAFTLVNLINLILFLLPTVGVTGLFYNLKQAKSILIGLLGLIVFIHQFGQLSFIPMIVGAVLLYALLLLATDELMRHDLQQLQVMNLLKSAWLKSKKRLGVLN